MTPDVSLVLAGLQEERRSVAPLASWQLRPAAVVTPGADSIIVKFDGEGFNGSATVNVPAVSLIGYAAFGARVMIMTVPPEGNYVVADLSGATAEYAFSDTIDTTTSTSYISTDASALLVGTSFIVPASGKVKIEWGGEIANSAGSFTLVSYQIAEGLTVDAGGSVVSAGDSDTARNDGASVVRSTNFVIFDAADYSIIPGTALNVALYHRVGAGTGTVSRRRVSAVPVR